MVLKMLKFWCLKNKFQLFKIKILIIIWKKLNKKYLIIFILISNNPKLNIKYNK